MRSRKRAYRSLPKQALVLASKACAHQLRVSYSRLGISTTRSSPIGGSLKREVTDSSLEKVYGARWHVLFSTRDGQARRRSTCLDLAIVSKDVDVHRQGVATIYKCAETLSRFHEEFALCVHSFVSISTSYICSALTSVASSSMCESDGAYSKTATLLFEIELYAS